MTESAGPLSYAFTFAILKYSRVGAIGRRLALLARQTVRTVAQAADASRTTAVETGFVLAVVTGESVAAQALAVDHRSAVQAGDIESALTEASFEAEARHGQPQKKKETRSDRVRSPEHCHVSHSNITKAD